MSSIIPIGKEGPIDVSGHVSGHHTVTLASIETQVLNHGLLNHGSTLMCYEIVGCYGQSQYLSTVVFTAAYCLSILS